jgi:hypothetical protein
MMPVTSLLLAQTGVGLLFVAFGLQCFSSTRLPSSSTLTSGCKCLRMAFVLHIFAGLAVTPLLWQSGYSSFLALPLVWSAMGAAGLMVHILRHRAPRAPYRLAPAPVPVAAAMRQHEELTRPPVARTPSGKDSLAA